MRLCILSAYFSVIKNRTFFYYRISANNRSFQIVKIIPSYIFVSPSYNRLFKYNTSFAHLYRTLYAIIKTNYFSLLLDILYKYIVYLLYTHNSRKYFSCLSCRTAGHKTKNFIQFSFGVVLCSVKFIAVNITASKPPAIAAGVNLFSGVIMSLHYQVNTEYSLTHGKPSLTGLSINTTKSACTTLPVHSEFSLLKTFRIFRTLQEAYFYIACLHNVYNQNPAPLPELDSGQKELFSEVIK